jgi:hypothetical protein
VIVNDVTHPPSGTALSAARKVVADFLRASRSVPLVCFQRVMPLAELHETRQRLARRPSWCALFTKAFARVVAARPALRRAFLPFPRERFHDYSDVSADVIVESSLGGEEVLLPVRVRDPHCTPLWDVDNILAAGKNHPLGVRRFARAMALTRLPRFLRRLVWWYVMQASGSKRERYFGTFGISSVAGLGINSVRPLAPWTTILHYGVVGPDGDTPVYLSFDHRVFDGSEASRALIALEYALLDHVLPELRTARPARPSYRTPERCRE